MNQFSRFPKRPVSDDEYIRRLRRSIALWDRYRVWFMLLFASVLSAYICLLIWGFRVFLQLGGNANMPLAVLQFFTGVLFGFVFSWPALGAVHQMISGFRDMRIERLVLKYHDALHPPSPDDNSSADETEL